MERKTVENAKKIKKKFGGILIKRAVNGRGYWCARGTVTLRNQYPEWYGTYEVWQCSDSF